MHIIRTQLFLLLLISFAFGSDPEEPEEPEEPNDGPGILRCLSTEIFDNCKKLCECPVFDEDDEDTTFRDCVEVELPEGQGGSGAGDEQGQSGGGEG